MQLFFVIHGRTDQHEDKQNGEDENRQAAIITQPNAGPCRDEQAAEAHDNGPGLPAKVREHLFEPFQGSTRVGGTGLGLAIARDLMRGHGGDVALARSDEDGTTFVLRLPVEEKRERIRFGRTSQTSGTETGPPANAAE